MKPSFLYYCAIVLVALSSVLAGLDWMSAPMSPMPEIKVVAYTVPPPPVPRPPPMAPKLDTPAVAVAPSTPVQPEMPVAPKPAEPAPAAAMTPPAPPVETPPAPVAETPRPLCDVAACAAAYRSFRESDCTFNPSFGPRRLCTKGVVPKETETKETPPQETGAATDAPASIANPEPGAAPPGNASCNVSACAAAYRSFTESDCTYQPSNGPRRACTK